MHIVVAPDSFKGSLSAKQVGDIIGNALMLELPHASISVFPMADGGEGTVDSFLHATGGKRVTLRATGPDGRTVTTYYGALESPRLAVIEIAAVAGLSLVPVERRNPMLLGTYGVGECILHALDSGFSHLIIGLGGSATNDGGIGMLQALGAKFYDRGGTPLPPIARSLAKVHAVDFSALDPRVKSSRIVVASDVTNVLCGLNGASYVYGPQKGATPEQIEELDKAMEIYASRVEAHLGRSLRDEPGAGAAGGLGFALLAVGAVIESGADILARVTGLDASLRKAHWVVTGEGKTDSQTLQGKLPYNVAMRAKQFGVPTILISGSLDGDLEPLYDVFESMHAIANGPISLEQSVADAESLIRHKARNIARLLRHRKSGKNSDTG